MAFIPSFQSLIDKINQDKAERSDGLLSPNPKGPLQVSKPSTEVQQGNKAEQGQSSQEFTKSKFQNPTAILEKNRGANTAESTGFVPKFQGQIANAGQALQQESNSYLAKTQYQDKFSSGDLDNAVGKINNNLPQAGVGSFEKLTKLASQYSPTPISTQPQIVPEKKENPLTVPAPGVTLPKSFPTSAIPSSGPKVNAPAPAPTPVNIPKLPGIGGGGMPGGFPSFPGGSFPKINIPPMIQPPPAPAPVIPSTLNPQSKPPQVTQSPLVVPQVNTPKVEPVLSIFENLPVVPAPISPKQAVVTSPSEPARLPSDQAYSELDKFLNNSFVSPESWAQQTDTDLEGVSALSLKGGVEAALRESKGPGYTRGSSRLDSLLLGTDPQFRRLIDAINSQNVGLQESSRATKIKADDALKSYESSYKAEQDDVRNALSGRAKEIEAGIDARVRAENNTRAEAQSKGKQIALGEAIQTLRANGFDPNELYGLDPSQFYSSGRMVDRNDLATTSEVGSFDKIMQLLRGESSLKAGNGEGTGDPYRFDQQGFLNAVRAAKTRKEAEHAARAEESRLAAERAKTTTVTLNDGTVVTVPKLSQEQAEAQFNNLPTWLQRKR